MSLVYGMHAHEAQLVIDRRYEQVDTFSLEDWGEQETLPLRPVGACGDLWRSITRRGCFAKPLAGR